MERPVGLAIETVLGSPSILEGLQSIPGSASFEEEALAAINQLWDGTPKLLKAQDFKDHYYDEKWKGQNMTAFHPERLPDLWQPATASNWILLGAKPDQAIAVVHGKIDPAHKTKRFKVVSLIELPNIRGDLSPVERRTVASEGRTTPGPDLTVSTPGDLVTQDVEPEPNPAKERTFTPDAVAYAAWALDCLNRKQYADAKAHIISALRRNGYYK